jgi:hypothetical protein
MKCLTSITTVLTIALPLVIIIVEPSTLVSGTTLYYLIENTNNMTYRALNVRILTEISAIIVPTVAALEKGFILSTHIVVFHLPMRLALPKLLRPPTVITHVVRCALIRIPVISLHTTTRRARITAILFYHQLRLLRIPWQIPRRTAGHGMANVINQ